MAEQQAYWVHRAKDAEAKLRGAELLLDDARVRLDERAKMLDEVDEERKRRDKRSDELGDQCREQVGAWRARCNSWKTRCLNWEAKFADTVTGEDHRASMRQLRMPLNKLVELEADTDIAFHDRRWTEAWRAARIILKATEGLVRDE